MIIIELKKPELIIPPGAVGRGSEPSRSRLSLDVADGVERHQCVLSWFLVQ
jgi:hypothetical protein